MRLEPVRAASVAALLPIIAGGCRGETEPVTNVVAPAPAPRAAPTPEQVAQRLVRERLGAAQLSFASAQVFTSQGATVFCGRVSGPGQPDQRYIAIGEEDVFVESQVQPGQMDQAVNEFCRNA